MLVAALVGIVVISLPSAAVGQFGDRPWHYVSPIFTPKTGTSFTTLWTSGDDASQSMLLRRYDAVGTLLTSQAVTIGAHGSLQASPAAHSGAPLHVEVWSNSPAIMCRITYTDSSDVVRTILPDEWRRVGPDDGVALAVHELQGTADSIEGAVSGVQTSLGGLTTKVDAVAADVGVLKAQGAKIDAIVADVGAIKADVGAIKAQGPPAPDPRVAALQTQVSRLSQDVTRLRAELRSLRQVLLRRIPARRR